jgi:hypothetical protein
VISASLDSVQLLIGHQTQLHVEVAADKSTPLILPMIPDTLTTGVEVLGISTPDTTDIGNNRQKIQYDYTISSFDSALYVIPALPLIAGSDTVYSGELYLKVSSLPVDTESGQFYDIKPVIKPEFVLMDYLPILLYVWGFWLIVGLIALIIYRIRNKKPILPFFHEEKIVLPPHTEALQALDEIKARKLWQQGKEKEYYSLVADTIRYYIGRRFDINAMEMPSGDTLAAMRGVSEADFVFGNLKQLLQVSDLVKFAKYQPLPEENELSIGNAYLFVNSTTPVEAEKEEEL